ncbi:putative adenylyltransferase/sulfurtransferase MoeZ [Pirellula sp. SH-Sr6A]|uniref:rhodanese-like domain-containing protein n=1 Tax=Pirellula sp. SH-Sr6A TaxID=1632865 RepID=UPI00078E4A53|nr:rhodanese-like domain-containing protein [Pirellula sp. SH-Sr6A]AMV32707.1 putative adenylyltransferase/sulfurtransferase MoeZ [Pirellula sp. SH-Sr6A]
MEIDIHTVSRWLDSNQDNAGKPVALVDCREPHEFDIAKIDGAILMPMSQWPPSAELLSELENKTVVVHCHHGGRSLRVANWFRHNGHPEALSMAGGIDKWSMDIDPSIPRY